MFEEYNDRSDTKMEIKRHPLYAISGISGSGKTTLGNALAEYLGLKKVIFVDQDHFYLKEKPLIQLSDGSRVKNWDCLEALSSTMKMTIHHLLLKCPVVIVGFALCRKILPVIPDIHIHLITADNPQDLEERCKQARLRAKSQIKAQRDALMVKEVVIPFYHKMVRESDISHLVRVFDESGQRIALYTLLESVKCIIEELKEPRKTHHIMNVSQPYHGLIKDRVKPVEGRKISQTWKKIRCGDTITMTCKCESSFDVKVTGINMYLPSIGNPLKEYLLGETLERTLPGVTEIEEGKSVYLQWSSKEEINKFGMMGITIEVI